MIIDRKAIEFEWDKGNIDKNKRHRVEDKEAEELFFDDNKVIYKDIFHSQKEKRFIILGKTRKKRLLYVVFAKRDKKIRVISARDINKREVKIYEEAA